MTDIYLWPLWLSSACIVAAMLTFFFVLEAAIARWVGCKSVWQELERAIASFRRPTPPHGIAGDQGSWGRLVSVRFRSEDQDVEIEHDGGYEPDTNAHVIEWHFYGLTAEQHDALKITDEEDQSIYEQLIEASWERDDDSFGWELGA